MSVLFHCQLLLRQTQTEKKKKCVSVFERGEEAWSESQNRIYLGVRSWVTFPGCVWLT